MEVYSALIDVANGREDIKIHMDVDDMVYKTDVNNFVENSGVTVQNIAFPIEGYHVMLGNIGEKISCGTVLENLFFALSAELDDKFENSCVVFDFTGVKEVSESFLNTYTKILLRSSNKIIGINMSAEISTQYSDFIKYNVEAKE